MKFLVAIQLAAILALVTAHPGGHKRLPAPELLKRQVAARERSLLARNCAPAIAEYQASRKAKRNALKKRQEVSSDSLVVSSTSSAATPHVTSIQNFTCITAPEVTEGPYYINNELVRQDLTEDQPGLKLILDIGVLDITTCEPLDDVFVEIWSANATGVYGGYAATLSGGGGPGGAPPNGTDVPPESTALVRRGGGNSAHPNQSSFVHPSGTGRPPNGAGVPPNQLPARPSGGPPSRPSNGGHPNGTASLTSSSDISSISSLFPSSSLAPNSTDVVPSLTDSAGLPVGTPPNGGAGGPGGASASLERNETFCRGGYATNGNGIVELTTIYPGFYEGRTPHIHTMVHLNWEKSENGTLISHAGSLLHIGQFFFEESWNDQVFTLSPYTLDTNNRTLNVDDSILAEETANGNNAYIEIELLGDDISEGLLGFVTMGVNSSAVYSITNTNYLNSTTETTS